MAILSIVLSGLVVLILIGMVISLIKWFAKLDNINNSFNNLKSNQERIERTFKEEMTQNRQERNSNARRDRQELMDTLEKRLGESFTQVSQRLESVYKGLGQMQNLASNVGDLKNLLSNVKIRGSWGEVQLGMLLEQLLTPHQYAKNVVTKKGSNERVEYAIKLPGRDKDQKNHVWMPIDAKFPQEDYQRLLEAQDKADAGMLEKSAKQLEIRIKSEAKNIRDKYIDPPHTTDYGILFLPIEGLFAEVLRRPGLVNSLQRDFRVQVTGPTTLGALLNSLQMGFRTLAIEKRSSQVWQLLGAVKTEFSKFGDILDKIKKKMQETINTIDTVSSKARNIQRKLNRVEQFAPSDAHPQIEDNSQIDMDNPDESSKDES